MGTVAQQPIIPPNIRAQMQTLGLTEDEIYSAFNSSVRESGPTTGTTVGIADYPERVVRVTYMQNPDTLDYIVVAISVQEKIAK